MADVVEQQPKPSVRSLLAKATSKLTTAEEQRYAEEHAEPQLAAMLGPLARHVPGTGPTDVEVMRGPGDKRAAHGVELKTLLPDNKNAKVRMGAKAMRLKRNWATRRGAQFHLVVFDDRLVKDALGPGKHDYSKRAVLYRRGWGSPKAEGMLPVRDDAHLRRLLSTPTDALPPEARPNSRKLPYPDAQLVASPKNRGMLEAIRKALSEAVPDETRPATDDWHAWLRGHPSHADAVVKWTGTHYRGFRERQRGQSPSDVSDDDLSSLDEALSHAPVHAGTAYRGLAVHTGHSLLDAVRSPGTLLESDAHSSWSRDPKVARDYAVSRALAMGSSAVPVLLEAQPGHELRDVSSVSRFPIEREVVLPKGSRYAVAAPAHGDPVAESGGRVTLTRVSLRPVGRPSRVVGERVDGSGPVTLALTPLPTALSDPCQAWESHLRGNEAHDRAVSAWTGEGFRDVRNVQMGRKPVFRRPAQARQLVRDLTAALRHAPEYDGESHRGISLPYGHPLMAALSKPGVVLRTNAHSSWTKLPHRAREFAASGIPDDPDDPGYLEDWTRVVVHAADGHGLPFRDLGSASVKREREVVLPHGTTVTVVKPLRRVQGNRYEVTVAAAPPMRRGTERKPTTSVTLSLQGQAQKDALHVTLTDLNRDGYLHGPIVGGAAYALLTGDHSGLRDVDVHGMRPHAEGLGTNWRPIDTGHQGLVSLMSHTRTGVAVSYVSGKTLHGTELKLPAETSVVHGFEVAHPRELVTSMIDRGHKQDMSRAAELVRLFGVSLEDYHGLDHNKAAAFYTNLRLGLGGDDDAWMSEAKRIKARIGTIKGLQPGEVSPNDPWTPDERLAVYRWMHVRGYKPLRAADVHPQRLVPTDQDFIRQHHRDTFLSAVAKAPVYQGVAYRGMHSLSDDFLRRLARPGAIVRATAHSSASVDPLGAEMFTERPDWEGPAPRGHRGAVLLTVHTRTAADLTRVDPYEEGGTEVLLRPGTRYRIESHQPPQADEESPVHRVTIRELEPHEAVDEPHAVTLGMGSSSVKRVELPHPFKGRLRYGEGGPAAVTSALQGMGLGHLTHEHAAALFAPDGRPFDDVELTGTGDRLTASGESSADQTGHFHSLLHRQGETTGQRGPGWPLELYHRGLDVPVSQRRSGMGTSVIVRQVKNARAFGIDRLRLQGIGKGGMNYAHGYYGWPRMGFDGMLPHDAVPSLGSGIEHDGTVGSLMRTQPGREWWLNHGKTVDLRFDVRPDSHSSRVLDAYVEERRRRGDHA